MATTRAHEKAGRLALLGLACAASLLAGAVAARADGGPHVADAGLLSDTCASCHRAHTSTASRLLAEPQPALCYTCHGSSATGADTDVVDGVGYSDGGRSGAPGALRGGGFSYALIDSSAASGQQSGYPNPDGTVPVRSAAADITSTHSADSSTGMAWGNGPISAGVDYGSEIPLRCGSCHDPHGNGNYRTLRPIPRDSGGAGVTIPDATTKVYTTENYWRVEDVNAPSFIANISAWCATCHTRYLTDSSYAESGDAVFTKRHRSDQTAPGSANCAQCHVSHGSNATVDEAPSGGVHSLAGVPAPAGSYLLRIDDRGVCQMCHKE